MILPGITRFALLLKPSQMRLMALFFLLLQTRLEMEARVRLATILQSKAKFALNSDSLQPDFSANPSA